MEIKSVDRAIKEISRRFRIDFVHTKINVSMRQVISLVRKFFSCFAHATIQVNFDKTVGEDNVYNVPFIVVKRVRVWKREVHPKKI